MPTPFSRAALAFAIAALVQSGVAAAQTTAPGPVWGGKSSTQAPGGALKPDVKDNMALIVMGRSGCPVAVIGHEVWNLDKQQKLPVIIPHNADRDTAAALSDDGKFLVVGKNRNQFHSRNRGESDNDDNSADATVWDTQTGAKVCDIPSADRDLDVDLLALAGDQYVIICAHPNGNRNPLLEVWDAKTGKLLRRFPCNFNNAQGVSLSPDGRYAAIADAQDVNIYDLASGKLATSMPPLPNAQVGLRVNMHPGSIHVYRTTMSFINLEALAFSPDGNELAGAVGPFDHHFFAWNHQAELVNNFTLPYDEFSDGHTRPYLQWTPDRTAWIVNQHWLLDRKTQRFLWSFPTSLGDYPDTSVIDDKRLFVMHHGIHAGAEFINIPWDAIHKAQSAMTTEAANALLKPGDKVSLDLTLVHPRGDDKFARDILTNALTKAFESSGIKIADNQPAVVTLSIEEAADIPRDIVRMANPFGGQTEPTGRKAAPDKAVLTLTIHARASDTAIFKLVLDGRSSDEFNGTITDDSLRQSLFTSLAVRLEHVTLPYFLSKTDPNLMLPLGLAPTHDVPLNFLQPNQNQDRNPLIEIPAPTRRMPPFHVPPPVHDGPVQRM